MCGDPSIQDQPFEVKVLDFQFIFVPRRNDARFFLGFPIDAQAVQIDVPPRSAIVFDQERNPLMLTAGLQADIDIAIGQFPFPIPNCR